MITLKQLKLALIVSLSVISFNSVAQMSPGVDLGILKSTDKAEALFEGELYFKYDLTESIRAGVNIGYYQTSDEFGTIKIISSLKPILSTVLHFMKTR